MKDLKAKQLNYLDPPSGRDTERSLGTSPTFHSLTGFLISSLKIHSYKIIYFLKKNRLFKDITDILKRNILIHESLVI